MKKIFFLFIFLLLSCDNKNIILDEISELKTNITKAELDKFSKKDELSALGYVYINKNTIFKNEIKKIHDNKKLNSYFNSRGITKHYDIVSIVFLSLHRELNSNEMKLNEQIKEKLELNNKLDNVPN